MPSNLPPGPELDAVVGRLIGWEPEWFEVCGVKFSTRKHGELAARTQGAMIIEHWPPVSSDGNAMLRLFEEMREREFNFESRAFAGSPWCHVRFTTMGHGCDYTSMESLPHAVALAALAALEVEDAE